MVLAFILYIDIDIVRTSFDLDPTQEWIQAHVAQTMNLKVREKGRKAMIYKARKDRRNGDREIGGEKREE